MTKGRFKLQALIDFGGRYIYPDNHDDTEYVRICSKHMDDTMRSYVQKMLIIFLAIEFCLSGPSNSYFVDGIKTTALEARVPFTEKGSDEEWLINLIVMTVIGGSELPQYIGIEIVMSLFGNIVTLTPKLVKHELRQFSYEYKMKSISKLELLLRFNNVAQQSLDIDE